MHWKIFENILLNNECVTKKRFKREILKAHKVWRKTGDSQNSSNGRRPWHGEGYLSYCCSAAKLCPTLCVPHGLQHTRLPCPSLSSRVCSNSCPLSRWYSLTLSSSGNPLLLLPSIFPSIRVFSKMSALHMSWPSYWSLSFSISLSNEYSGLISFSIDWFDLLTVQGTLSLLQHHNSKASVLWWSTFFKVQRSHMYMTTGKP